MSYEWLDLIWDNAKPCQCGNDDNWAQEMDGSIYCEECNEQVAKK